MAEGMIWANGVELCVETFGDRSDPAILLIPGAASSMYMWREEFCARLAAGERFVIRYDLRDSGRSVGYPPGQPGYGLADLVADAIGVLDALEVERAHVVGISMGGGIAAAVAIGAPERVSSLTIMASSPGGDDLPPMSPAFLDHVGAAANDPTDWSDRDAAIDAVIAMLRVFAGDGEFDEAEWRERIGPDLDRTAGNLASNQINHFVMDTAGVPGRDRLGEIDAPALIVHGDRDPLFALPHAEAFAAAIPDSELLVLAGTAHLIPPATDDVVVPALLRHTAAD